MTYYVYLRTQSGQESLAATYDSVNKTLVPVDSRVSIEAGVDSWALVFNDEYVMIIDDDGLSVGDIKMSSPGAVLVFYECGCGYKNVVAEINEDGILAVRDIFENTAPSGFNIRDTVSFSSQGMSVTNLNEIWLLSYGGRYLTANGLLLRVRNAN